MVDQFLLDDAGHRDLPFVTVFCLVEEDGVFSQIDLIDSEGEHFSEPHSCFQGHFKQEQFILFSDDGAKGGFFAGF